MAMAFSFSILLLFSSLLSTLFSEKGAEGSESIFRDLLYPEILRDEAVSRLQLLGQVSDADGYLERTFFSPASVKAGNLIRGWMEDAGLKTWIDCLGNIHGRVEGRKPSAQALIIGSHMDTVVDAGIFDGPLGIISALAALKVLHKNGKLGTLERPVEVIAFSDEEGVRFQSTFLGSAAVAGILPASALQISDRRGITLEGVLKENSIDITEEKLLQLKYDPESVWAYVEVHIEQGPVLEWAGFPLGVVNGIAGQTRLKVTIRGSQGHAGTVPMSMRQDPMAAAAEMIVLLESLCKDPGNFLSFDGNCNSSTLESLSILLSEKQKEMDKEPIKEASEEISRRFKTLLDSRDLDSLKQTQHLILGRLQDSNAVLSHFNEYSENCYAEVSVDLAKNTRVLKSMKADLDYIFQKLRSMKSRMLANYPDAFPGDSKGVLDRRPDLELP